MYSIDSVNKNISFLTTRQESGVRVCLVIELSLRCMNAALCQFSQVPSPRLSNKKGTNFLMSDRQLTVKIFDGPTVFGLNRLTVKWFVN